MKDKKDFFPWFIQNSIPTAFDDSLSYLELLSKVLQKLNDIIDYINNTIVTKINEIIKDRNEVIKTKINEIIKDRNDVLKIKINNTSNYSAVDHENIVDLHDELKPFQTNTIQAFETLHNANISSTGKFNSNVTILNQNVSISNQNFNNHRQDLKELTNSLQINTTISDVDSDGYYSLNYFVKPQKFTTDMDNFQSQTSIDDTNWEIVPTETEINDVRNVYYTQITNDLSELTNSIEEIEEIEE